MFVDKMKNEGKAYGLFKIFNALVMLAMIAVTLIPYWTVFVKSLNDGMDAARGGLFLWPRQFTWDNYKMLLDDPSMYRAAFVTLAKVVLQVVGGVLVQFMAAYALSRKELWGLKIVNIYFLIPMYISGGLISSYVLFSNIGLLNNFSVYILPCLWNFYNVIIIRSYMQGSIPDSIIEAARVDGAHEWTLFSRIIIPLCKPILATVILWIAVGSWNEWVTTLYYIQDPNLFTLQYKLMQVLKETERIKQLIQEAIKAGKSAETAARGIKITSESIQSAQIIVVTLPIIAVYPFAQKYFVKGVTLGAVKG